MKYFRPIIALICSLSLLCGMVPSVVFAGTETMAFEAEETPISDALDLSSLSAEDILGEDETRREANVKHFKLVDGSMVAVSYPVSVHEEVEGEWQEIDHSLTPAVDVDGDSVQSSAARNVRFSFVNGRGNRRLVKAEDTRSDARILFELEDADKKELVLSEDADGDELFEVTKAVKKGIYREILPDTDIEYILAGTTLKENVIVKKPEAVRPLRFILHCKNVTAVLQEDQSVLFTDKDGEEVFSIPAPFMTDAARAVSEAVAVTLEEHQKGYVYTMTPSTAWTSDPARVYPVIIDPMVESEYSSTTCHNAVWQKTSSPLTFPSLYSPVGQLSTDLECGALIRMALPSAITETSMIQKAILRVHCIGAMEAGTGYTQINAYQYGETWDTTQRVVAETTEPTLVGDAMDYCMLNDTVEDQYIAWDITEAAKRWTSTDENFGVLLRVAEPNGCWSFGSFQYNAAPSAIYQYRDVRGVEEYWTYTTVPFGNDGVIGVNNNTGNVLYAQQLLLSGDVGDTLPLTLTYSSNFTTAGWYANMGVGFSSEYHITVGVESDTSLSQAHPYYLTDGDGTVHYFVEKSVDGNTVYVDEDNLGYTLAVDSNADDAVAYTLTDRNQYVKTFDGNGHLLSIADEEGEELLSLSSSVTSMGYVINSITCGSATATMAYERWNDRNRLTAIRIDNETVCSFTYNEDNYLTKMVLSDGREISLVYSPVVNDTPYLSQVTSEEEAVSVQYTGIVNDGRAFVRATQIQVEDDRESFCYTMSYGNQTTSVTDQDERRLTYQFDDYGRTVGVVDPLTSRAQFAEYGMPGEMSASGATLVNQLLSVSETMQAVGNYIEDPSMTSAADWSVLQSVSDQTYGLLFESQYGRSDLTSAHVLQVNVRPGSVWLQGAPCTLEAGWYTASAYVSTNGETLTGGEALLRVEVLDEEQNVIRTLHSHGVNSTDANGWKLLQLSFELGEGETTRLSIGTQGAIGSFWIDDVSLEQGEITHEFNLLANPAFENGSASWNTVSTVQDGVLQLASSPNSAAYAEQTVGLNSLRGNKISFGVWAKADSVPTDPLTAEMPKTGQPSFAVELRFLDADGETVPNATVTVPCNDSVEDWQFVCAGADIPAGAVKAVLCLHYDHNLGTAYFDDAFVYMNGFTMYDYESEEETESEESSVDYTQQHQWYAFFPSTETVDGQSYESYVTQIVEGTPVETLTAGETYYILNAETGDALYAPTQTVGASVVLHPLNVKDEGFQWTLRGESGSYFCRVDSESTLVMTLDDALNTVLAAYGEERVNAMSTGSLGDGSFAIATGYSYGQQYLDKNAVADSEDSYSTSVTQKARDIEAVSQKWLFIPCDYNAYMETQTVYDANGNVLQEIDENGGVTTYTYVNGQVTSVTDASGNVTTYAYDQDGNLLQMQNGDHVVSYVYENGELVSISKDNVSLQTGGEVEYALNTDAFGRPAGVAVGNAEQSQSLVSYLFNDRELVQTITYGNDDTVRYLYNSLDSLTELRYTEDERAFAFAYYDSGETALQKDYVSNRRTRLNYDENGNVSSVLVTSDASSDGGNVLLSKTYSSSDENEVVSFTVGGTSFDTETVYNEGWNANELKFNGQTAVSYTYDAFGRITSRALHTATPRAETMVYLPSVSEHGTSSQMSAYNNSATAYGYAYYANGQLATVSESNFSVRHYVYDALGQLTQEWDRYKNTTTVYTYDHGGNLLQKATYVGYGVTSGTPAVTTYAYEDDVWADLLTSFNGTAISYDEIGNPLNWTNGATLTWQHGRELGTYTDSDTAVSYTYNENGIRTSKTVNGVKTTYILDENDRLVGEVTGENTTAFLYDESGCVYGFLYNGVPYYYLFNGQGDVVRVVDADGAVVATYNYDAWGGLISATGAMVSINPIRYRGYYYDTETALYYLQTRYYDPAVGRFLNADDVRYLGFNRTTQSYNLFSYCENDPTNKLDAFGNFSSSIMFWLSVGGKTLSAFLQWRNWENNCKYTFNDYIYGQGYGNASKMKMGFYSGTYNGCGWIATYNALYKLGYYVHPAYIINYYESSGSIFFGTFGISPFAVVLLFQFLGYKIEVSWWDNYGVNEQVKKGEVSIIFYSVDDFRMHYIMAYWDKNHFKIYNLTGYEKSAFVTDSIRLAIRKMPIMMTLTILQKR